MKCVACNEEIPWTHRGTGVGDNSLLTKGNESLVKEVETK